MFPNRAHNDYLEFALEAGLLAPIVLLTILAVVAMLCRTALRREGPAKAQTIVALGTLTILGLHSFVDYPMRTMALAAMAGAAVGLLSAPRDYSIKGKISGTQA